MGVDNATLARRYTTEIWGKNNLEVVDELVDQDIVLIDPMSAEPARGIATLKQRVQMSKDDMSETSIAIQDVVASGDTVAIRHKWTGVRTKDFFGVPAKGKRMAVDVVEWIRIKNGKVVENASFFDIYSMFQQLGALPPPEQFKPAERGATTKPATA